MDLKVKSNPTTSSDQQVKDRSPSSSQIRQPSSKRARKTHKVRSVIISIEGMDAKPCYLTRLPLELLAEILLYMPSTKCVLALARCSKYFCATLVNNESSVFIWRRVRATCKPTAIPDPTPDFTEPAYAVFIFDGGECEVCKRFTPEMYLSFALRVRLCRNPHCHQRLIKRYLTRGVTSIDKCYATWTPSAEFDLYSTQPDTTVTYWPSCPLRYRNEDVNRLSIEHLQELEDRGDTTAYENRHRLQTERLPVKMKLCVDLQKWKRSHQIYCIEVKKKNEVFSKSIATKSRWTNWDLVNSHTYGELCRNRGKIPEEVQMSDYEMIRPTVEAEVMQIMEARQRRAHETAYRRRRDGVEQHFEHLKSSGEQKVLPNLAQFRELPIVSFLQSKTASKANIADDFKKSNLVSELLQGDLKKWQESARAVLATTLGFPKWKSANKAKLHPVDRLTARFRCKRCGPESLAGRCLNFVSTCAHVCACPDWKKTTREKWSANQFEKDEQAIDAVSQVLVLCDVNAEDQESFQVVEALGTRIQCNSCEGEIVMDFQQVISHAPRHENMQLSLLSTEEADSLATHPLEPGTCLKLLAKGTEAEDLRGSKNYGCRLCIRKSISLPAQPTDVDADLESAESAEVSSAEGLKATTPKPKLFNFNGLRSHLKAKHGIRKVFDEDIFCRSPLAWGRKTQQQSSKDSSHESLWDII